MSCILKFWFYIFTFLSTGLYYSLGGDKLATDNTFTGDKLLFDGPLDTLDGDWLWLEYTTLDSSISSCLFNDCYSFCVKLSLPYNSSATRAYDITMLLFFDLKLPYMFIVMVPGCLFSCSKVQLLNWLMSEAMLCSYNSLHSWISTSASRDLNWFFKLNCSASSRLMLKWPYTYSNSGFSFI